MKDLAKPENQSKARERSRCKNHEGKLSEFYCETCKELVCLYCTEGKHAKPNHSYVPLTEFAAILKDRIRTSSSVLAQQLNEGNKLFQDIENTTQRLKDNAKKAKDSITQDKLNIRKQAEEAFKLSIQRREEAFKLSIQRDKEAFKLSIQKLEEKANQMIDEADKKYKGVREPLAKQKAEIKTYTEKVKGSANLAKKLIANGSDEELVSLQKKIDKNVKKIKLARPCDMKPVHDGKIEYKVKTTTMDPSQYENIVNNLGEVACHPTSATACEFIKASQILNGNHKYCKQLRQWMDNDHFQWRLCYRASRDGWSAQNFHRNCDNMGPTLTLVQVHHCIFGGYTDQSWRSVVQVNNSISGGYANQSWAGAGSYKQSNSSFLFSLQNNDAVPAFKANVYQNPQCAICCSTNYGPTFGGGFDLYLASDANTCRKSYSNLGCTYQPPTGYTSGSKQTSSLLAGSINFTPTEVEVFY